MKTSTNSINTNEVRSLVSSKYGVEITDPNKKNDSNEDLDLPPNDFPLDDLSPDDDIDDIKEFDDLEGDDF